MPCSYLKKDCFCNESSFWHSSFSAIVPVHRDSYEEGYFCNETNLHSHPYALIHIDTVQHAV